MAIDQNRLEAWLASRAAERRPMLAAVYEGLLARVRRGDFEEEQER